MNDYENVLVEIAEASRIARRALEGEVSTEIADAASLVVKYVLIAMLPRNIRAEVGSVCNYEHCALCDIYLQNNCASCPLSEESSKGCGGNYTRIYASVRDGSYLDSCLHLYTALRDTMLRRIANGTQATHVP